MHTSVMQLLLQAGANPELRDNNGRDVVALIRNLRSDMPLSTQTLQRRLGLEEVNNCLLSRLYEEVVPAKLLQVKVHAVVR